MSKRREPKIKDLCDVTPTLSEPQIMPILSGNLRMKGPADEANSDLVNTMADSQHPERSNDLHRSQKVDQRGVRGTCNVCSAPCSSCSHVDKFHMRSNYESTGEACADNIVVNEIRHYESGQTSEVSTVAGGMLTSNSFSEDVIGKVSYSEDVIGKGSSRVSEACASDDSAPHSRHGITEGHDDCLSCATTDELSSKKHEHEKNLIRYSRKCISRESHDEVAPKSLTGLYSKVETHNLKSMDDATVLLKGQNEAAKEDEKDDNPSDTRDMPLGSQIGCLNSALDREAENGAVCRDPPVLTSKSTTMNDDLDMGVPPNDEVEDFDMEVPRTNEVYSDLEVLDVNICDICGDAGREYLLALCSRCGDGAEHTYCMRKRLDKVPEGEWVCEECAETVENERQDKIGKLDENEKVNVIGKLRNERGNKSVLELNRAKGHFKPPGKRSRDDSDAEISAMKKPAIEQTGGSPKRKTFSSGLDNFLKNQNKSRLQSLRLASNNVRGAFSKSNSFNDSTAKAKLVDQAALQLQKSSKEHAAFQHKDVVTRSLGKSLSFRSTMSNGPDSRTKLISPRLAHIPDKRSIRDQNSVERQHCFRRGQPLTDSAVNMSKSSTSRFEKVASSSLETSSPNALTNQREKNIGSADGKSVPTVSRSSSFVARSTTGEFKRPPIRSHSTVGVSSATAVNDIGPKSVPTGLKEDIYCSVASECAPCNSNDGVSNVLPQFRDNANSSERLMDSTKLSKDGPRKPGIRKSAVLDQCDAACSNGKQISFSDVEHTEKNEVSGNVIAVSSKLEIMHKMNKSSLVNAQGLSSRGAASCVPSLRNASDGVPMASPFFLNSTAIPEHEFIWQGSFEIHRSGRTFELWDGMQAHLSTCASSKVVDAVNTFANRIILYEVPRVSIWPVQFQNHGVREDNIAIFFFAKDYASYHRNYKVLVDKMVTNDLAFKGNVNDVELLIFPSSQLPDNMKRWNKLFFIWGVFRGKRDPLSRHVANCSSLSSASEDVPQAIVSSPESKSTSKLSGCDDAVKVIPASQLGVSPNLLSSSTAHEDRKIKRHTSDDSDRLNFTSSVSTRNNDTKKCHDMRGNGQEGVGPLSKDMRSSNTCQTDKDIAIDRRKPSQIDLNSATDDDDKIELEESIVNIEHPSILKEDRDSSKDRETRVRKRELRDLNMDPESGIFSEENLESCDTPHSAIGGLPRNGGTCNEPRRTLEHTVLPPPPLSHNDGNSERHFFPIESSPLEVRASEQVPNLELGLGAESNNLLTQHLLGVKTEERIFLESAKKVEDANEPESLSLSLSFPFPESRQRSEPGTEIERPVSDGKGFNKKRLFSL